jgi:hypothetical protein
MEAGTIRDQGSTADVVARAKQNMAARQQKSAEQQAHAPRAVGQEHV